MVMGFLKQQLQAAGAAFQLLTRIPVPAAIPFTPQMLARSVVYYPLVGAVIGGIVAAAGWLMDGRVPPMPSAVILLFLWLLLSGGLHLDGLMDTADGVLSHRKRERMLEIMKDSRVGAMGVLAAVMLLLFKFSTLSTWLDGWTNWPTAAPLLALACGLSRLWLVFAMVCWPFARPDEGLASLFKEVRPQHAAASFILQLVLTALCFLLFPSLNAAGLCTIMLMAGLALITGALLSVWLTRKLGGLTGDTYGASVEIIEAVLLFALMLKLT
ncbi:adenosylcobinamide-GDP ribazoletransferase [Paenibacillus sp. R14(2021)]|uniref:adenosylcobinamide-GDP ribazoletransferase n=1 Tax=Paenibacillus sp. R14(2021) TaxID=2859228 RepID=UPI001C613DEF|nr:adenosylcobinamide-GDP ribazoletransferase [Paenibacillus sp. R14(2021)]